MDEPTNENTKKKRAHKPPSTSQQAKINLIKKLSSAGILDDKQLCGMTPAEIIEKFHDITKEEMQMLFALQLAVGSGTLYAFLCAE